jgi:hypothetical protein
MSAYQSLVNVMSLQWGSFAEETVQAMFTLRQQRLFNVVQAGGLAHAVDVERYSALALSAPLTLASIAPKARNALACSDLPQGSRTPTVTLSTDSRARLQYDCLHRRFLLSTLGEDVSLLHVTVQHCVANGLAPTLLIDSNSSWISDISQVVWCSAQNTDNPLHRLLHRDPPSRGVARLRESRSLGDLAELDQPCDCLPRTEVQRQVFETLQRDLHGLCLRDDDFGVDYDEAEDDDEKSDAYGETDAYDDYD